MDPEQARLLAASIQNLAEVMDNFGGVLYDTAENQRRYGSEIKDSLNTTKESRKLNDSVNVSLNEKLRLEKITEQVEKQRLERQQNFNRGLDNSVNAVKGFVSSLLSSQEGVGKYGGALTTAGEAINDFSKNFGPLGKIAGGTVNLLAKFGAASLELTDNMVELRNSTVAFAGALPISIGQLGKLAKEAGFAMEDMKKLQKPLQYLGSNLVGLGETAGRGAVKFIKMADVSEDVRQRFSKMGISATALMDLQAGYIKQQAVSGRAFELQGKTAETLKKESLEYAEQITRLSSLTGESADSLQQQQEIVKSEFEEQIKVRQENIKIQQLEAQAAQTTDKATKERLLAQASDIKQEQSNRQKMLDQVTATLGRETASMYGRVMRTGTFDEFSAGLATLGVNAQELSETVKKSKDPIAEADKIQKQYSDAQSKRVDELGQAGQYLSAESRKQLGLGEESLRKTNLLFGEDIEERRKQAVEDARLRQDSTDALENNIAGLESAGRNVKAFAQTVLEATNPLNMSFDLAASAAGVLAAALTAAAMRISGGGMGGAGGAGGAGGGGGGKMGALKKGAMALGRFAGPVAAGFAAVNAYQGFNADEGASTGQKLMNAGSSVASGLTFGLVGKSAEDTRAEAAQRKQTLSAVNDEDVKKMIMQHEGVRYEPYQDSLGKWTVGVGHLIGDGTTLPSEMNRSFSKEEVQSMFEQDYYEHKAAAERMPGYENFNSSGKAALIDLAFNMGPNWYKQWPKFSDAAKTGNAQLAAESLQDSAWYKQVGDRAPTIVNLISNGIQAKSGGIASGPTSGFPATLHGNEMIQPLDPNSMLQLLATTPAGQESTKMLNTFMGGSHTDTMEMIKMQASMIEVMAAKLDSVIDKLELGNDIQGKLLNYTIS